RPYDARAGAAAEPPVPLLSVGPHGLSEPRRAPPDAARRPELHPAGRGRGGERLCSAGGAVEAAAPLTYPQRRVVLPSQRHRSWYHPCVDEDFDERPIR